MNGRDQHVTRLKLDNSPGLYPCLQVHWWKGDKGWWGTAQVWNDGETAKGKPQSIDVQQSTPLGQITVTFASCKAGCYRTHSFEGARLDERDLQWATAWAALALELKTQAFPEET